MLEFEKELKTRRLREIEQIEKSVEVDLYNNQQKRLEELEEFENKIYSLSIIEKAYELEQVSEDVLNKARSGVYKDTPYNRKHGRAGVRFGKKVEGGDTKELDGDGKEKESHNVKEGKIYARINSKGGVTGHYRVDSIDGGQVKGTIVDQSMRKEKFQFPEKYLSTSLKGKMKEVSIDKIDSRVRL